MKVQLSSISLEQFSLLLILLFVGLTVIMIGLILIRKMAQKTFRYFEKRRVDKFRKWVMNYTSYAVHEKYELADATLRKLRRFKSHKYSSEALLSVLMDYGKILKGRYHDELCMIYGYLQYDEELLDKLSSKRSKKILKALDQVLLFGVFPSQQLIMSLIMNPNSAISNKALKAALHFRFPVFEFAVEQQLSFTLQKRIIVFNAIRKMNKNAVPELSMLINSLNPENRLFALEIIYRFKLKMYMIKLIRMIQFENNKQVFSLLIRTIKYLNQNDQSVVGIIKHQLIDRIAIKKPKAALSSSVKSGFKSNQKINVA